MATQSTAQAMALLKAHRAALIAIGKQEAVRLAKRNNGFVHSRMVYEAMKAKGYLNNPAIKDYWLGAVFNNNPDFEFSGETEYPPKPAGRTANIHAWRPVKIWRLVGWKQTKKVA